MGECDVSRRIVSSNCEEDANRLMQRFGIKLDCRGLPGSQGLRDRGFINLSAKDMSVCNRIMAQMEGIDCKKVDDVPFKYIVLKERSTCKNVLERLDGEVDPMMGGRMPDTTIGDETLNAAPEQTFSTKSTNVRAHSVFLIVCVVAAILGLAFMLRGQLAFYLRRSMKTEGLAPNYL